MRMLARRRRAGKKGSKALEKEIRGSGDLVGAGGEIGDRGTDGGDGDRLDELGEHHKGLAIDGQARIEPRNKGRDITDRCERQDHAGRKGIQQIGLDIEGKLPSLPMR